MKTEHHLIYVPGLRDTRSFNKPFHFLAQMVWEKNGFYPHLYLPNWEKGQKLGPKLQEITKLIDELYDNGFRVSLIGQSAGGSAILNAFSERRSKVNGVVNIAGRLRAGVNVHPSLEQAAKISPAFKESVLLFEKENERRLTKEDRKKIMTIRPMFDEVVPASTVPVEGGTNLVAPIVEHNLGGGFISIFYSGKFLKFLKNISL